LSSKGRRSLGKEVPEVSKPIPIMEKKWEALTTQNRTFICITNARACTYTNSGKCKNSKNSKLMFKYLMMHKKRCTRILNNIKKYFH
jgi:hypothetical protein|tara:strand:+ start:306 stop:566 length:261 start_codon:yes stop_codon:yes gene_type:complete